MRTGHPNGPRAEHPGAVGPVGPCRLPRWHRTLRAGVGHACSGVLGTGDADQQPTARPEGPSNAVHPHPFPFHVGQVFLLRQAVGEFPRGTPVKIVTAVTADGTYAVESYVADGRSTELRAGGARLTVGREALAASLPEFRSGRLIVL